MDRLIVGEMIPPVLFGLGAFSTLIIIATLLRPLLNFIIEYHVPASITISIFALGLPQVIVATLPLSMLVGTLLAFSRLSGATEIVAMKAAGISLRRMMAPALVAGLFVTGCAFLLNERVVPAANARATEMKNAIVLRKTGVVGKDDFELDSYNGGKLAWVLFAKSLRGDRLTKVNFFSLSENGSVAWWIDSDRGLWRENHWTFYDGRRHQNNPDGTVLTTSFKELAVDELNVTPRGVLSSQKSTLDMPMTELWQRIKFQSRQGLDITKDLTDFYFKLSTPFTAVLFVLLAVPLAVTPQRTSSSVGMGLSLLIVFVYYMMYILVTKFAQAEWIPPLVAAWVPNGMVAAAGVYLLIRRDK
jgi:lipopolysaccharide export system permease protein